VRGPGTPAPLVPQCTDTPREEASSHRASAGRRSAVDATARADEAPHRGSRTARPCCGVAGLCTCNQRRQGIGGWHLADQLTSVAGFRSGGRPVWAWRSTSADRDPASATSTDAPVTHSRGNVGTIGPRSGRLFHSWANGPRRVLAPERRATSSGTIGAHSSMTALRIMRGMTTNGLWEPQTKGGWFTGTGICERLERSILRICRLKPCMRAPHRPAPPRSLFKPLERLSTKPTPSASVAEDVFARPECCRAVSLRCSRFPILSAVLCPPASPCRVRTPAHT
jgi:hypothetical protein